MSIFLYNFSFFPTTAAGGTLMFTDDQIKRLQEAQEGACVTVQEVNHIKTTTTTEANQFSIKVQSPSKQNESQMLSSSPSEPTLCEGTDTFRTINQQILDSNTVTDSSGDGHSDQDHLQNLQNYANDSNEMSQFQVQLQGLRDHINSNHDDSLQKITHENVLMSSHAMLQTEEGLRKPPEFLDEEVGGERRQHESTNSDHNNDSQHDHHQNDTKQFLQNETFVPDDDDDNNSLFIKDEVRSVHHHHHHHHHHHQVDEVDGDFVNKDSSSTASQTSQQQVIKSEISKQSIITTKGIEDTTVVGNQPHHHHCVDLVDQNQEQIASIVYVQMSADNDSDHQQGVLMEQQQQQQSVDIVEQHRKKEEQVSTDFGQLSIKSSNTDCSTEQVVNGKEGEMGCLTTEKGPSETQQNCDKTMGSWNVGNSLRLLAPRLQTFPLYSGAHNSIGIGKNLLKPYTYIPNSLSLLAENGQYFEVLGRCSLCFKFGRTTSFCRSEKNHREPKAGVCVECESAGNSTIQCRRKLNHDAPNAQPLNIVINTAMQIVDHVKQLCIRNSLPACFAELQSIVIHHADIPFVAPRTNAKNNKSTNGMDQQTDCNGKVNAGRKTTDYARGYLYPYTPDKWREWLEQFSNETGTSYRVRTGKRVNKKSEHHGLANHNGNIVFYSTLETQLYNCSLGGRPRKRKPVEGRTRRKERGSKLIGCSAVIHTRVLETKTGWKALEITAPKLLAHLPFHDPRINHHHQQQQHQHVEDDEIQDTGHLISDFDQVVSEQQVATELDLTLNTTAECFDIRVQPTTVGADGTVNGLEDDEDIGGVVGKSSSLNQDVMLHTSVAAADPQKTLKQMLLTCASLVDSVDNQGVFTEIQNRSQKLFEFMLKETIGRNNKDNVVTTTAHINNHQQQMDNAPSSAKRKKKKHSPDTIIETSTNCVNVDEVEEDVETKTFPSDVEIEAADREEEEEVNIII